MCVYVCVCVCMCVCEYACGHVWCACHLITVCFQSVKIAQEVGNAIIPSLTDISTLASSCVAVDGCDVGHVGNGQCDPRCNVTECKLPAVRLCGSSCSRPV